MGNKTIVEVRSAVNDNVVMSFEHTNDEGANIVTAGFSKICSMLKINRVQAENQYYVTKR
ncbi:hypothetical protein HXA34_20690 [Salipaludibacillus agaradhaerens]|jgi:hypothetical protein|uniref:hypothetical protein n=1 Tax=Salipaludibacillus agaradhaerens TaxID=76935 RepID=UPI0021512ACC|nr:hypothetical protein [Salipaludibacillus agaradhaerens]MCR6108718.1 hypothetical protein [Salipaludibacillus agaradhaerens]MCR6120741.1 hypothetical protein [Salipaludibacillus agaradhaerens]